VCQTYSVLAGYIIASIEGVPLVKLACGWYAEFSTLANRCVEVLTIYVQAIGVKHAVSRHTHALSDRIAVIAWLQNLRPGTRGWVRKLNATIICCCCVDTIDGRCRIRIALGVARSFEISEVAGKTVIISQGVSKLQCLNSKPAVRAALFAGQCSLIRPGKELRVAVLARRTIKSIQHRLE
jgi:hypothetical protein